MRYFRVYPWGMQLLMFGAIIITMLGFAGFMMYALMPRFSGYALADLANITETSPARLIRTAIVMQGLSSLFLFFVPAFLFAYLTHPRPAAYLGLKAPGANMQPVLAVLVVLGAMPLLQGIETLISYIDFGAKVKAEQAQSEHMMGAFLTMPTFTDFLRSFVVMAIIPALGEELFFRGVMMRLVKKRSLTMLMPIIFTALVFAYSHTNIYGYLSIFLAGVLLACIYYLTGSIWCSILAHLFFNGTQVVLSYISITNVGLKNFLSGTSVPLMVVGAVVFAGALFLLVRDRTPLPPNWTDDFTREELARETK